MSTGTPGREPTVDELDVIRVLQKADTPVLTTTMVADELPIGRRATLDRLKALYDEGRIERLEVGPRGQVWWPAEDRSNPETLPGFGMFADDDEFIEGIEEFRKADEDALSRAEDAFSG